MGFAEMIDEMKKNWATPSPISICDYPDRRLKGRPYILRHQLDMLEYQCIDQNV